MKHIDFSNIGLGMELSPSFSKQLQEGLLERLAATLKGLTNNAAGVVILDGCVMTKVGDQYDQTAGIVYYNGEILTVDVFTGNHATQVPVYQAPSNTFTQQAWYGDSVKRDTFYSRKLPMVMATSGSGIADYNQVTRIEGIKANVAQAAWTNINLINGWVSGADTAQYRVDSLGRVELRGIIDGSSASSSSCANNIPINPTRQVRLQIVRTDLGGFGESSFLNLVSTPNIVPNGTGKTFSLDGLNYWMD